MSVPELRQQLSDGRKAREEIAEGGRAIAEGGKAIGQAAQEIRAAGDYAAQRISQAVRHAGTAAGRADVTGPGDL